MQNFKQFGTVVSSGEILGMKSDIAFSITSMPLQVAYHGRPFVLLRRNLSAETEIGQLDTAVHPQENIVRFDITMNDMAEKKMTC